MKKKTILLLLAITFTFALSACGQTIDTTSNEVTTVETTSEFKPETETEEPTPTTNKEPENNPIEIASTTDTVVAENSTENSLNSKEAPKSETKPKTKKTKTKKKIKKTKKKYTVQTISNKTMYAKSACNIRKGPSTNYDKAGSLSKAQKVTVNGKVTYQDKTWFRLKTTDGSEQFVASSLLSDTKPTTTQKSNSNTNSNSTSNTQKNTSKNSSSNNNKGTQKPSNSGGGYTSIDDIPIPDDWGGESGSPESSSDFDFGENWNVE